MQLNGVRARLTLLVALSGLLPLALFGAIAALVSGHTVRASVIRGNRLAAETLAARIDTHVSSYVTLLHGLVEGLGLDVHLDRQQIDAVLRDERMRFPELTHLELCGLDGQLRASGEPVAVTPACSASDPAMRVHARDDVYRSSVTFTPDLRPQMTLAVPLLELGSATAVLRADVDLTALWGIIDAVKVGEQGRARLADEHGRILAHGDPRQREEVFRGTTDGSAALLGEIDGGREAVGLYRNGVGDEVLGVGAPVPQLGWAVVVEQPTAEAFRAVHLLWIGLVGAGLFFLIAGALVGRLVARTLTRPLDSLHAQADAIGTGDLAPRALVSSPIEMRTLGDAMNRMAVELERLQERIKREERLSVLARTASGLVHDLKHPLAAIRMAAGAVFQQPEEAFFRDTLRRVLDGSFSRIDAMFEEIRRVVRNDPVTLMPGEVDLSELAAEVLRDLLVGNTLNVDARVEAALPIKIVADRKLLYRGLVNLGKNALEAQKARGPGKVRISVEPGDAAQGEGARVVVEDEGVGIAPARLPALFTALDSTKTSGFGIGLASVKKIVDEHGGSIQVQSEVGKGSRFVVILPPAPPFLKRAPVHAAGVAAATGAEGQGT